MAKCQNLTHVRGDDINRSISIRDRVTNVPIDITGYKFYYTLKTSQDDADASAVYQNSWTLHVDAEGGLTSWNVPSLDTKNFSGTYYYDICFIDNAGDVTTVLLGEATFVKDITRAVN